ncbi:hypothetical protein CYMTET_42648 [Cymbomonas tetramitiformis]|uniref:RCC1-like domain-containing protein n=1 Tax=Cymbomonas tetramitiformis TaxID=36881 RepID=A0AAE0F1A9_9CHLO|nr:hypothetical protein CYMTET_42648 [Cymbomonas tetramitiformis]
MIIGESADQMSDIQHLDVPLKTSLYLWGLNTSGESGSDPCNNPAHFGPVHAVAFSGARISSVACGWHHTAVVSCDGKVYTCGSNEYGQLGTGTDGDERVWSPRLVSLLLHRRVTQVACGAHFTVAIATVPGSAGCIDVKEVWSWGRYQKKNYPTPISSSLLANETVSSVACGQAHALLLTESGTVFSWGYNQFGQLGRARRTSGQEPLQRVQHFVDDLPEDSTDEDVLGDTHEAGAAATRQHVHVVHIACGGNHSLCIGSLGELYTWGCGDHGQLGYNDAPMLGQTLPRRVQGLRQVKCVAADGGTAHSSALTQNGELYTWGCNTHGELGLGEGHAGRLNTNEYNAEGVRGVTQRAHFVQPTPVMLMRGVVRMACGECHTLVHDIEGLVLGFGYNMYHQAGSVHERGSSVWTPRSVGSVLGEVAALAAGGGHSAVVCHCSTLVDFCEEALVCAAAANLELSTRLAKCHFPPNLGRVRAALQECAEGHERQRARAEAMPGPLRSSRGEQWDSPFAVGAEVRLVLNADLARAGVDTEVEDPCCMKFDPRGAARVATMDMPQGTCDLVLADGQELVVHLQDVVPEEKVGPMLLDNTAPEEKMKAAEQRKICGNRYFNDGHLAAAAATYVRAVMAIAPLVERAREKSAEGERAQADTCALAPGTSVEVAAKGGGPWRPGMVMCDYDDGKEYDIGYTDDVEPDEEDNVDASRVRPALPEELKPLQELWGSCLCNLARVHLRLLQMTAAVNAATMVLGFYPDHLQALYLRGKAYMALGDLKSAAEDLRCARRLRPQSREVWETWLELKQMVQQKREEDRHLASMIFGLATQAKSMFNSLTSSS